MAVVQEKTKIIQVLSLLFSFPKYYVYFAAELNVYFVNHQVLKVVVDALLIFTLNLPFGYLRSRQKKLSFKWFLYIHLPVPLVILVRILSHIGFALYTYPLFVAAFFLGQVAGRKLNRKPV